jgi:hypothetical protein
VNFTCEYCDRDYRRELDGDWVCTWAGTYYDPPEYDWVCNECITSIPEEPEWDWEDDKGGPHLP